ncbi:tRNA-splicing endonuclease [Ignicoccus islandicus DSM 13165]|uniref:tRNA-splicing endonuclease n=1 Tax=Ignicoccus islandicus DSM 13165 TaxID=940295 RepID=A0A0U3FM15_9CREN|nr:tRNA-intron lyase [Ignicoccus islandicus]ALU11439.1 tRNA-splicing endonuclease [Ignicoccus islandicus DSM 13165]
MKGIRAYVVGDRSVVLEEDAAKKLYWDGFFGHPFTTPKPKTQEDVKPPLVLSPLETIYLTEKGVLRPIDVKSGKELSLEDLWKMWGSEDVKLTYSVYKELRDMGFVVRSGLKYGSDFAVYEFGPGIDHAPFLVDVKKADEEIDPAEMVRSGRMAHGVKKRLIFSIVKGDKINHIVFKWVLP